MHTPTDSRLNLSAKFYTHIFLLSFRALKDQGYQSDSTLVYKKRSEVSEQTNPVEQKQAYISLQAGGEVPLHGFRKPMPEKPKGESEKKSAEYEIFKDYPCLTINQTHLVLPTLLSHTQRVNTNTCHKWKIIDFAAANRE